MTRIQTDSRGFAAVLVVAALAALVTAPVIGAAAPAAQQQADDRPDEYSIVQGGECTTVTSLGDGSQTVEEFYDYRTPETEPSSYAYSSFGTTHLQRDNTSTLFFYRGSEGISLVVLHGRLDGDTEGGAVTMEFRGLPSEGEWVVEDDDYGDEVDAEQNDEYVHRGTSSRITWVYTEARNDGAAFRGGLEDDFEITVDPAFNDDADFRVYNGTIDDWEVVSAAGGGYERTSLDFEEIRILPGPCRSLAVTGLDAPANVTAGESATVEATVVNEGNQAGTFTVPVRVDGYTAVEREVTLEPGERRTVSATIETDDARSYDVAVADQSAQLRAVEEPDDGANEDSRSSGFGWLAGVVAALIAAAIARRR